MTVDSFDGLEIAQIRGNRPRRQHRPQPPPERDDDARRTVDAIPGGVQRQGNGTCRTTAFGFAEDAIFQESVVARGIVEDGALGAVGDHYRSLDTVHRLLD